MSTWGRAEIKEKSPALTANKKGEPCSRAQPAVHMPPARAEIKPTMLLYPASEVPGQR